MNDCKPTAGVPAPCPRRQATLFTLVELLAAMAVLTVLMLVLFSFLSSAQRVWSATNSSGRIYENARVAFDLITRDLQCAVASDKEDGRIPFYVGNAADAQKLAIVTNVAAATDIYSEACEVSYSWTTGAGVNRYLLRRARTRSNPGTSGSTWNSDWDFFGKTTANPGTPPWYQTLDDYHEVIRGVSQFAVLCLNSSGAPVTGTTNQLPAAATVSITLFDDKLMSIAQNLTPTQLETDNRINKSFRTFTKTIFIGGRN